MNLAALGMRLLADEPAVHSAVVPPAAVSVGLGCSSSTDPGPLPVLLGEGRHPVQSQALLDPELKAQVLT